jgi:response regulator RpfG family c-di-GMP phosphodiesterase
MARTIDDEVDEMNWMVDDSADPVVNLSDPLPWRILIVDDDEDVHAVTRLVLSSVTFKGRGLELLSANSAAQAWQVLGHESDIALVLLDVVMETNDAGLVLAKRIRDELRNGLVRIVLRTGQPGQAPEERVIIDFDINDYKSKTELTKQKLFTTVIASLRAYEGLVTIERNRVGLSKILHGASNLYELRSLQEFSSGVLNQVIALLDLGVLGALCIAPIEPLRGGDGRFSVLAATGQYASLAQQEILSQDHPWMPLVQKVMHHKHSFFDEVTDAFFVHTSQGQELIIVLSPPWPLADYQRDLLGVFCDRIAAAFDNLHMYDQLQKGQEATVIALADLAESRDTDTGGHVRRVAQLTNAIATRLLASGKHSNQVGRHFFAQVGLASMLHDIGKVATPDAVLLKPGGLTPEERSIMELHAIKGESVLMRAAQMVGSQSYLTVGAEIAGGHHEHFDGNGYPRRLSGQQIPLGARIVAAVDVFDALLHKRPYKEPWPLADVIDYMQERRGKQFDPDVVNALIDFVTTENSPGLNG